MSLVVRDKQDRLTGLTSFSRAIGVTALLSFLFPYFSFIDFGSDNQFYVLITAMLVILLNIGQRKSIFAPFIPLILVTLFAAAILFISGLKFSALRALYGYIALTFITLAAYYLLPILSYRFAWWAMASWFGVAVIQFFINPTFLTFLISRSSTSQTRGVTSLAVEPSYFAYMMTFLMILANILYNDTTHNKKMLITQHTLFISSIILSKSSSGYIILFIYYMSAFLSRYSLTVTLATLLAAWMADKFLYVVKYNLITVTQQFSNNRAGALLSLVLNQGLVATLALDDSFSSRLTHIIVPIYASMKNFGLPHGYEAWVEKVSVDKITMQNMLGIRLFDNGDSKIMSGLGQAIFELGFIGLIPVLVSLTILIHAAGRLKDRKYYAIAAVWFFMHLQAVPLAYPVQWLIIGITAAKLQESYITRSKSLGSIGEER